MSQQQPQIVNTDPFDLYSPEFDANPYPAYAELMENHPCYWSEIAGKWVLTRYEDVFEALHNWQQFSSAQGNLVDELPGRAGNTLGSMDPPRHDQVRSVVHSVFAKRNLDHMIEPIRALTNAALDGVEGQQVFDFSNDVSARVTVGLLCALMGLPDGDNATLRDMALIMAQTDPITRQKGPKHIAAFEWVKEYAEKAIRMREEQPGDDIISQMLTAEVDGTTLTFAEVQTTMTTLIMAGVESLSGFLSMMALNLADFPEARRELVANPELISGAIEESLRYNTTAQRFRRVLPQDLELHGQQMKAGDFVILCYGAANRDPRKFADPDVFDIHRNPKGHLGFGGGVHLCLGAAIGRLAAKVFFEEFLKRIPEFTRTDDPMQWVSSSNFRSPLDMKLKRG
ncbi:MAG: cytochrome P450 [Candidatus Thiodiazotropha sp.]